MIALDDIKVCLASVTSVGTWWLNMDIILKCAVSLATLVYIIIKIAKLIK